MATNRKIDLSDPEVHEWLESLDYVLQAEGPERVQFLLRQLQAHAYERGVTMPFSANTPPINTIHHERQPLFPGNRELERRIKSLIRWNAMAMVVRANRKADGLGGHISTFASCATLYEIGFNHFWRARSEDFEGDLVYFQGHSSPGVYARAFLEGRLTREQLRNFRRELAPAGGLSSYPHPWLMPNFWQFPTVSMGLTSMMAIYQARFGRYLEDRGLKPASDAKVWAMLGDGEMDEPESLGAITLPARERLDNLIFVVNCNLQRLDGPVRGNGHIVQELEAAFRGAGWNVIKVLLASDWDDLLERDVDNYLVRRLGEVVDGEFQKYTVESGAYIREHFWGVHPELAKMVEDKTDDELKRLGLGGHDPVKVYAAYQAAMAHTGSPTVILARTIKGYGLGEAGEGKNITHQQKKLNEDELREFRSRFGIPLSDEEVASAPLYLPAEDSAELKYLRERREALGGYFPARVSECCPLDTPPREFFAEFFQGTEGREVSTTMAFVRMLSKLLKQEAVGKYIVPIVPDEARTFGMEALFRQCGIYSHAGQLYEPVDSDSLLYYRETTDGQILEEGITEAGSMASFIAAGSSYSTHGIPTIPFFIFYSMFGFQRIGDLIWAAGDMQARGFLVGGTAGRTTLNGEGLQHQDGHSHVLASTVPNLVTYDPAFAYEIAVIIQDGLRRMYHDQERIFYYLTVENQNYAMPPMPEGVEEGILKGMYLYRPARLEDATQRVQLLGTGSILTQVLDAQDILEQRYGIAADVWSVTSYKELRRDALEVDRWNMLHPNDPPRVPYVTECLQNRGEVVVAASDYMKALPDGLARWCPLPLHALGTDGFGRSETREALRDFFEVDGRFVTLAALSSLARNDRIGFDVVQRAMHELEIRTDKPDPVTH